MQLFLSIKCLPLFVGRNWWNILIVLETIEEQKIPETLSYVVFKRLAWLYSVTAFLIIFLYENFGMKSVKRSLQTLDSQNNQGTPKWEASEKSKAIYLSPAKSTELRVICIYISVSEVK